MISGIAAGYIVVCSMAIDSLLSVDRGVAERYWGPYQISNGRVAMGAMSNIEWRDRVAIGAM